MRAREVRLPGARTRVTHPRAVCRDGSALASLGKTCVVSLHLDATSEDKRVKQLAKCLQMVSSPSAAVRTCI